jgi:hypothetical protein
MALSAGSAPTAWNSTLTGMALEIYNQRLAQGIYLSETPIEVTISTTTYTETTANRNSRVLAAKKNSYADALAIVNELTVDAEVSTTVSSGISVSVDPNTGIGATTGTGAGSGGIS